MTQLNLEIQLSGKHIVRPTREALMHVYGEKEHIKLVDMQIMRLGFLDRDKVIGNFALRQLFDQPFDWVDIVHRFWTFPNSQVKNFLCACRTYLSGLEKVHVLLKGSSAGLGSGSWVTYYARMLAMTHKVVVIECYDPSEVPGKSTISFADVEVHVIHHAVDYKGNGKEFDVVVDDAWSPGQGPARVDWQSRVWSQKGVGDPFLHSSERRMFSQKGAGFRSQCQCMVCKVVSDCVQDYQSYQFLRNVLHILGHVPSCVAEGVLSSDLLVKGSVRQGLLIQPTLRLFRPVEFRALISLRDEIPVKAIDRNTFVKVQQDGVLIRHVGPVVVESDQRPVYKQFEGKRVAFSGCEQSILGATTCVVVPYTAAGPAPTDITFFGSVPAFEMNPSSKVIYVRGQMNEHLRWHRTGARHLDFEEYTYRAVLPDSLRTYRYRGVDYPPIPFAPRLTDDYGPRLRRKGGKASRVWWKVLDDEVLREPREGDNPKNFLYCSDEGIYGFPSHYEWEDENNRFVRQYLLPFHKWTPELPENGLETYRVKELNAMYESKMKKNGQMSMNYLSNVDREWLQAESITTWRIQGNFIKRMPLGEYANNAKEWMKWKERIAGKEQPNDPPWVVANRNQYTQLEREDDERGSFG